MNIERVGTLTNKSINNRYFFDIKIRQDVESIITRFCNTIGYTEPLKMEWRNLGEESELYEFGVALRVNGCYELRYKLISEDFNFWYYDRINPKCIIEDCEPSDDLEPILLELFKCLAEDYARITALNFLKDQQLPNYPDDPVRPQMPVTQEVVNEVLRRY
jgi:hypothetical protein